MLKESPQQEEDKHTNDDPVTTDERSLVEDLILQNKTLDALLKGLSGDIETFKNDNRGKWTPADIVRFTMQLNIMKDKRNRNLLAINEIIKKNKKSSTLEVRRGEL